MTKVIDVNKEWGSDITCYAMGDDNTPDSVEHFVDTCMSKLMRTDSRVVFDMTNMRSSPSIQMTYIIAYRLVKSYEFKKKELSRICLLDGDNPFLSNVFTQAVMEAFVDYKISGN